MIKKPLSVRVAGFAALTAFLIQLAVAVAQVSLHLSPPPYWFEGILVLVLFPGLGWWLIGTAIHRSRMKRMRHK